MSSLQTTLKKATALLDAGKSDEAIDVLRVDESTESAEICTLLAKAYFQRGDSKGDVYSSVWFAERALALGATDDSLRAIVAVGAFRKEDYVKAVMTFQSYVTDTASTDTKYLYGLALHLVGCVDGARKWLSKAAEAAPDDSRIQSAIQSLDNDEGTMPAPKLQGTPGLGGVRDRREPGTDTPYDINALSKLAGQANTAKDLYWQAKNVPCQTMCPAGTDIPAYLTAIYNGDHAAAYGINLRDNVFPAVLGRVCARPCETDCRHGWDDELGNSVAICHSKRAGSDLRESDELVALDQVFDASGKTVAVVGAGVAGLAPARNLALYGHDVTVYEKHNKPGGMMNQGIPTFRLPRKHIDREIDQIRALGVEIICSTAVGEDITLGQLIAENDAVVMAAGTLRPNLLDLPGKELAGIQHGLPWLLDANETGEAEIGENVVIVGGGFTAMDCARTALRLGTKLTDPDGKWQDMPLSASAAKVQVIYRRSVEEMLVTPGELEELEHEGIGLQILASPIEYLGADGKVTAVKFIRNELGEPDASGRRRPQPIPGSEFEVPANLVLLATGQFPDTNWIDDQLQAELVNETGWLASDEAVTTANKKIFAAGDFATGARSLIDAVGHGKDCARAVDTYLMGEARLQDVVTIEDITDSGRIREMDYVDIQQLPTLPLAERTLTSEVETGYDPALATDEAQRCYRCHIKYEIDPDKCIYCDWCVKARAREDCIVKVSGLEFGEAGEITGFRRAAGSEDTNLIYINQEECIRCNQCVDACPVDAISIQRVTKGTLPCTGGRSQN